MAIRTEEQHRALVHRKRAAASGLFVYLFWLRYKRPPADWESRLGMALITGELVSVSTPRTAGLRYVHEVAAEVADALTTSEAVMVSKRK